MFGHVWAKETISATLNPALTSYYNNRDVFSRIFFRAVALILGRLGKEKVAQDKHPLLCVDG
ncbi:hypothetical protein TRIP_B350246 [uncultured Desulfatiglans sp.]|uniref:Uncharacterized protein n=1 Tax=Uncultured Desulfatiglans sp. TaxID=1748965 RepID=A0A653ABZ2_UNCDX|nr:hypothetical protein TRIP_B350246 [uncultured Desulfatiglans sp.]